MSAFILAIIACFVVAMILYGFYERAQEVDDETASRRRILRELRNMETHREDHIINNTEEES